MNKYNNSVFFCFWYQIKISYAFLTRTNKIMSAEPPPNYKNKNVVYLQMWGVVVGGTKIIKQNMSVTMTNICWKNIQFIYPLIYPLITDRLGGVMLSMVTLVELNKDITFWYFLLLREALSSKKLYKILSCIMCSIVATYLYGNCCFCKFRCSGCARPGKWETM